MAEITSAIPSSGGPYHASPLQGFQLAAPADHPCSRVIYFSHQWASGLATPKQAGQRCWGDHFLELLS